MKRSRNASVRRSWPNLLAHSSQEELEVITPMNSSAVILVRAVALAVLVLFDVHADDHRPGERERPRTLMVEVRWLDRVPFAAERQLVERAVDAWAKRIVSYGAPAGLSVPGPVYLVYPPYTGVDQPHMPMQRTLIHGELWSKVVYG